MAVSISNTHLSHIETSNTKLSLQLFVDIANALSVQTDERLYDNIDNRTTLLKDTVELLASSSVQTLNILINVNRNYPHSSVPLLCAINHIPQTTLASEFNTIAISK